MGKNEQKLRNMNTKWRKMGQKMTEQNGEKLTKNWKGPQSWEKGMELG